jgi:FdrA protein
VPQHRKPSPNSLPRGVRPDDVIMGMNLKEGSRFALDALRNGRDVIVLGSDLSSEPPWREELRLKRLAVRSGRWVLTPHAFAHRLRNGPVAIVGTAGTGIQQLACLLHRAGVGVSKALGVGSRDCDPRFGGIGLLHGLQYALGDPATKMVILILKHLPKQLVGPLNRCVMRSGKPVVGYVIDRIRPISAERRARIVWVANPLESVEIARACIAPEVQKRTLASRRRGITELSPSERLIAGFFAGGSSSLEAAKTLRACGRRVRNTRLRDCTSRDWAARIRENVCIDFGSLRPRGTPHYPMADLKYREEAICAAVSSGRVGTVLFDVFLGIGGHEYPGAQMAAAIRRSTVRRSRSCRAVKFIGTVIGTEADPQNLVREVKTLRRAGAIITTDISTAARTAACIAHLD